MSHESEKHVIHRLKAAAVLIAGGALLGLLSGFFAWPPWLTGGLLGLWIVGGAATMNHLVATGRLPWLRRR